MKIAVTYENGNVYEHFGMATCVKFYEIENGAIASENMVETKTPGHGMIAPVIFKNGAEALITGRIKPGAANALMLSGILLCAGASGDAEEAVKAYIAGALQHDPELLILDEATSGLDPLMQREFFEILKERNQKGVTVFLSSHVMSEIQHN